MSAADDRKIADVTARMRAAGVTVDLVTSPADTWADTRWHVRDPGTGRDHVVLATETTGYLAGLELAREGTSDG